MSHAVIVITIYKFYYINANKFNLFLIFIQDCMQGFDRA
jgi:hypothetical protein